MSSTTYAFEKPLELDFDAALAALTDALQQQGFGVLTRIDVDQTLAKKLGIEFRRYVILGACNPQLAHQALLAEPQIGLLLPCNAVVQQTADGVVVSLAAPKAMFRMVDNPRLAPIADEADRRLRQVLDALPARGR